EKLARADKIADRLAASAPLRQDGKLRGLCFAQQLFGISDQMRAIDFKHVREQRPRIDGRKPAIGKRALYGRGHDRLVCGNRKQKRRAGGGLRGRLFAQLRELLSLVLGDQRARKLVEVAVHDGRDLIEREIDTVIRNPPLGKVVSAYALGTV